MSDSRKKNSPQDMGVEIDLRKVWASFVAQWKLILVMGIICGAIAFAYFSFVVTPLYTTDTIIMVLNKETETGKITNTDLTVSSNLSKDFVNIATSRSSLEEVDTRVGLDNAKVSASIISETRQIKISVTHPNPSKARDVADCVAEVAAERICQIMDIPDMVRTVDKAFVPESKSYPSIPKYTILGFLIGFILTWMIVAIVFLSNDKINVAEDVERYLDMSLLAVIPVYKTRDQNISKRGATHQRKKRKPTGEEA